jgi:protein-tyrosine phosphatase
MDGSNYAELMQLAPKEARHKVKRFLDFAPQVGTSDVPDPFYGGKVGFDHALDLIEAAAEGLIAELTRDESRAVKSGA